MAHLHFQRGPCSLYARSKATKSQFDLNHHELQFLQWNLNVMSWKRFWHVQMSAKKFPSLETGTVESIQMQFLVLVSSPAVIQGDIFQEIEKNLKITQWLVVGSLTPQFDTFEESRIRSGETEKLVGLVSIKAGSNSAIGVTSYGEVLGLEHWLSLLGKLTASFGVLMDEKSSLLKRLPTLSAFGPPASFIFCMCSFFLTTRHKAKAPLRQQPKTISVSQSLPNKLERQM